MVKNELYGPPEAPPFYVLRRAANFALAIAALVLVARLAATGLAMLAAEEVASE